MYLYLHFTLFPLLLVTVYLICFLSKTLNLIGAVFGKEKGIDKLNEYIFKFSLHFLQQLWRNGRDAELGDGQ